VGLAWRVATRITAEDLAEMLREDVLRRFRDARTRAPGIEFLSDNGSERTSHRSRPRVMTMGVIPWHTTRPGPESNSLAEAFLRSFKWDVIYQACLERLEDVGRQLPAWIEHDNR
jgi:putative transposase